MEVTGQQVGGYCKYRLCLKLMLPGGNAYAHREYGVPEGLAAALGADFSVWLGLRRPYSLGSLTSPGFANERGLHAGLTVPSPPAFHHPLSCLPSLCPPPLSTLVPGQDK